MLHNAPILDSEDRQLIDLNPTTAGGHACERTEMSARRVISNGHSVFIYDNVVDVLAPVRKAGTEPLDCPSNTGSQTRPPSMVFQTPPLTAPK